MPEDLLKQLNEKQANVSVRTYDKPRRYNMALTKNSNGNEFFIECHKEAVLNVELAIRHGCSLELRNTK
eukprot:IDg23301t1